MVKIDFHNLTEPAINDTNLNQMQLNIENAINAQVSGDTLPVGCIVPFTSDTVPENWLLCNGSAVSRTEYDLLFSIIGTSYGVGDGSTTFNLPNLKGRVAVGKDSTQTEFDNLGETGGEKTHTLTIDEMPSHDHTNEHYVVGTNARGYSSWEENIASGSGASYKATASTNLQGGGQAHNNLQPYQVTNYIIKARQSSGVVATVVDELNSTSTTDALSANQGRILSKSCIMCKIPNEIVTTTNYTNISSWQQVKKIGEGLSISNGVVKIGSNVNSVKVSCRIRVYNNEKKDFYGYIKHNRNNLNETWMVETVSGPGYNIITAETIVDVAENDTITVSHYGEAFNIQANSTTLLVEKLN